MSSPASDQVAGGVRREKSVSAMRYAPFEAFMAKLEQIDDYSHLACQQFPKFERHVLGATIRDCINTIFEKTVTAFKRKKKSAILFEIDVQAMFLKYLVRKSHRLGYINDQKLKVWSEHAIELGRMIGGWIKHERSIEKSKEKGVAAHA